MELPLHRDTGFYVNNFTILNKKISYSDGWNAHFAFCGKVLPELFYSRIYLKYGGERYGFYSRKYYTILNYFTGIIVGISAYFLTGANPYSYLIGLVIYGLLSSKPFSGVYFESAEQFEILPQTFALLLISLWMKNGSDWLVFIAFSLLFLDAFFNKLSSLIFCFIVSVLFMIKFGLIMYLCGAFLLSFFSFCLWVMWNKKNLFLLFFPALHHEKYWSPSINFQKVMSQINRKTKLLLQILLKDGSIILMTPIIGIFVLGQFDLSLQILCVVLVSLFLTYYAQPGLIWYYAIPLIPCVTILSTLGLIYLSKWSYTVGLTVFLFLVVSVLATHLLRYRGPIEFINLKVWHPYHQFMAVQNMELNKIVLRLREMVKKDNTVFLYGVCNQLYVCLDTAYPTRLVSAAAWLDHMKSDWQAELNHKMVSEPPAFIFSSDNFLDIDVIRNELGLDYREVSNYVGNFRLYQFSRKITCKVLNLYCKPYQTELNLNARINHCY